MYNVYYSYVILKLNLIIAQKTMNIIQETCYSI